MEHLIFIWHYIERSRSDEYIPEATNILPMEDATDFLNAEDSEELSSIVEFSMVSSVLVVASSMRFSELGCNYEYKKSKKIRLENTVRRRVDPNMVINFALEAFDLVQRDFSAFAFAFLLTVISVGSPTKNPHLPLQINGSLLLQG